MSIEIKSSIDDFEELKEQTWCCEFVLDAIENANKEDVFMGYLEEMFFMNGEQTPTITELNDYIRFQYDDIFEALGLDENGELEDEE